MTAESHQQQAGRTRQLAGAWITRTIARTGIFVAAVGLIFSAERGAIAQTSPSVRATQAQVASAPISPYVVSDLAIDVRAENAVKAREKAFSEALMKGFLTMLERLVPDPTMRGQIRTPQSAELGQMLQDFTTRNEQLAPTRYTATYELRFKPRAVDAFLASPTAMQSAPDQGGQSGAGGTAETTTPTLPQAQGQPSSGPDITAAGPSVILPFYQGGATPSLWSGTNPLRDALARTSLSDTTLRAPLGDLEDMQGMDEAHALNFTAQELQTMLRRYDATQAIVALAVPDGPTAGGPTTGGAKVQGVTVLLYAATSVHPKPRYLHTLSIAPAGAADEAALYQHVIEKIQSDLPAVLSDAEKNPPRDMPSSLAPMPSAGPTSSTSSSMSPALASHDPSDRVSQSLQILARFNAMNDWQQIRTRLSGISSVHNVRLLSLKTREARAEIVFVGSKDDLQKQLENAGLQLSPAQMAFDSAAQTTPNTDLLMTGPNPAPEAPSIYELTLSPWMSGGAVNAPQTP